MSTCLRPDSLDSLLRVRLVPTSLLLHPSDSLLLVRLVNTYRPYQSTPLLPDSALRLHWVMFLWRVQMYLFPTCGEYHTCCCLRTVYPGHLPPILPLYYTIRLAFTSTHLPLRRISNGSFEKNACLGERTKQGISLHQLKGAVH